MEEFGIVSMVCRPSQRAQDTVERCCSCTRHLTWYTTGLYARACECRNEGRQCTGCYCWGKCNNKGRIMPSPKTTRGILGHFPRGTDPPANNRRATNLPFRSPTSSSLRAILAAEARGRSAWGWQAVAWPRGRWGEGAQGRPKARDGLERAGGAMRHWTQGRRRMRGNTPH